MNTAVVGVVVVIVVEIVDGTLVDINLEESCEQLITTGGDRSRRRRRR